MAKRQEPLMTVLPGIVILFPKDTRGAVVVVKIGEGGTLLTAFGEGVRWSEVQLLQIVIRGESNVPTSVATLAANLGTPTHTRMLAGVSSLHR